MGAAMRRVLSSHNGTVISLGALLLGLATWQLYALTQPSYIFPSLPAVGAAFAEQIRDFGLLPSLARSISTLAIGFSLACLVGVTTGTLMGLSKHAEVVLNPYINALYVAPTAALVPIIILIGGVSYQSRVFVVFLFAVFEVTVNTYQGVKATPSSMLRLSRSFCANRSFAIRHVILPHSLPYVFAGFRIGIGHAVKGMIIAELLVEFSNLGRIIRLWQQDFRIAGIFSVVLLLMALGIVLTRGIQAIEDRLLVWRREVNV